RHGDDQHEEEVEESPVRDPSRRNIVDTGGMEETPAGWQVENAADLLEALVPTDGGNPPARSHEPAFGLHLKLALADFDAGPRWILAPSDQLVTSGERRTSEHGWRWHLETPALAQRSRELVPDRVAVAVEIEPPRALQAQLVGSGHRIAASLLDEPHDAAG